MQNFKQYDFVKFNDNRGQISVLSREITEKIETKQILATKDKGISANSRETFNQPKNHFPLNNERGKTTPIEKMKDTPIYLRWNKFSDSFLLTTKSCPQ